METLAICAQGCAFYKSTVHEQFPLAALCSCHSLAHGLGSPRSEPRDLGVSGLLGGGSGKRVRGKEGHKAKEG